VALSIQLPALTLHDLWRWLMIAGGLACAAHGLLNKNMRIRDSRTWKGAWKGKIVTKPWQIIYMRGLFILIGIGMIVAGLDPNFPSR
jgi:hypothetical protein